MSDHYPDADPPSERELLRTLAEAIETLQGADIRHLVIGGLGAATMGRPRSTDDIDLFVRPEDARRALEALAANGFEVDETFPDWLFKAFRHGALIDLIFRSSGDIYLDEEMVDRGDVRDIHGVKARVAAAEDLLVIKAVATKESGSHHWYDALAIIARADLDWDYLVHRAGQAGPRRVLSLLLYAESNDLAVPPAAIEALYGTVHRPAGPAPAAERTGVDGAR